jgi:hypothetical protein
MRTWLPETDPVRLAICDPEEIVYWPVGREQWVLLRWAYSTPTDYGTRIECEVIAANEQSSVMGRMLPLDPSTQVYRLNEMETLALAAL